MVCVCRVFKKTLPPPASGTTTVAQFLTPSPSPPSQPTLPSIGNNLIVKKSLATAQSSGLLTSVYESGLLSKAQAAGVSLSSLEPLLKLASENPDVLLLLESAGPDVLPLLPTILSAAPKALPILGALVGAPPPPYRLRCRTRTSGCLCHRECITGRLGWERGFAGCGGGDTGGGGTWY